MLFKGKFGAVLMTLLLCGCGLPMERHAAAQHQVICETNAGLALKMHNPKGYEELCAELNRKKENPIAATWEAIKKGER